MRNTVYCFSRLLVAVLLCFGLGALCPLCVMADAEYDFIVLGVSDTEGTMDPVANARICGGYARIATTIKQIKGKYQNIPVLVVSAGDDLMGRYFKYYQGKAIAPTMHMAGFRLACPGNHEFDQKPIGLAKAIEASGTTYITSDLDTSQTSLEGLTREFDMIDAGGIKIGVFSMITQQLSLVSSPAPVKQISGNIKTAKKMCKKLRAKGADFIFCMSHTGLKNDLNVVETVNDIDLLFGGHSHAYLDEPVIRGKTVVLNGGRLGLKLVCYKVKLANDMTIDTEKSKYKLIDITTDILPDPEVKAKIRHMNSHMPGGVGLGRTLEGWDLDDKKVRTGRSKAAIMICLIAQKQLKTDIFFTNAGAIRGKGDYPPGIITDTMLCEIDEFADYIYRFRIKGKHLKAILERGAACLGEGGFLLASGITWKITPSAQAQQIGGNSEKLRITKPGNRVSQIMVNGQPLREEGFYSVAANGFLTNRAGDGYFWFEKYGKQKENTGRSVLELLENELRQKQTLDPSAFLASEYEAA